MPTYDFACKNGHVRPDVWVSMFRDSLRQLPEGFVKPCEDCGEPMEKQPSAPAFTVNGFNAKNGYSK